MSHRITKELKRLCRRLLYITAVRIRPASCKRLCDEKRIAGEMLPGAQALSAGSDMTKSALDLIGRVLGSLPIYSEGFDTVSAIETFVCKLREEEADFSSSVDRPLVPHYLTRRTKVSRSPGLENLKVTLNLARGDLEEALLAS